VASSGTALGNGREAAARRDADLLEAWAVYRDGDRESEWPAALGVLTGRQATTWRGAAAQAEALAFMSDVEDPDPSDARRLMVLLRDALPRLADEGRA
jgi:hypothetical protein